MSSLARLTIAAAAMLVLSSVVIADPAPPIRRAGGIVQPDPAIQAAFQRLINKEDGLNLGAANDLARVTGAADLDNDDARRQLAEQFFLYAVSQKWAVEGYELYVLNQVMGILQATMAVPNSDFVIVAAPNIGHPDRTIRETAVYMLAMLDAFTPVKVKGTDTPKYHFRQLEHFLEHVQKLGLPLEDAASHIIVGMYRADPEAAFNTMLRMTLRAARIQEEWRAVPRLRAEREFIARVHFIISVGPDSDAAAAMKPGAQKSLEALAASRHWFARTYVPFVFLQEEKLLNEDLLDRLADDPHSLVRQAVHNVRAELQRREEIRRDVRERFERQ